MIVIHENTAVLAWQKSFTSLFENGYPVPLNGFYRNETAAIEIADISNGLYSDCFPMSQEKIDDISQYLVTGRGSIAHDWSKIYRTRLFEDTNHVHRIISTLKNWPDCPRAQVSAWKNDDIDKNKIAPCLQMLWFKIIEEKLCLHVHMRTSDCFGKLLMNFNEFIAVQKYVADELGVSYGPYTHFVDSLHFHSKDMPAVMKLYQVLVSNRSLDGSP